MCVSARVSLITKNNSAWQQCGVEERRKGWQLLLRRLPTAAKSLSSHLFSHTHITRAGHIFPGGPPQRNSQHIRSGMVERAKGGKSS